MMLLPPLLLLLLLLLPHMVCKEHTLKCTGNEPLPIPQEWYQPGKILIGGMATYSLYLFPSLLFKGHPMQASFDIPL